MAIYSVLHLLGKSTYYVKENGVLIARSWVLGTYRRELTFDGLHDVHVQQGLFARQFKCGSVVFVVTAGLEAGCVEVGGGSVSRGGVILGGSELFLCFLEELGTPSWMLGLQSTLVSDRKEAY